MTKTAIIAAIFALAAAPAFAVDYSGAKALCADAIAKQQSKTLDGAKTKLVKARDGGALSVTVKVTYADGATATGACKVRRGELESVELDG